MALGGDTDDYTADPPALTGHPRWGGEQPLWAARLLGRVRGWFDVVLTLEMSVYKQNQLLDHAVQLR